MVVASIGVALLVAGSNIFDNSYDSVESAMTGKQYIVKDSLLPQGQAVNSSIPWDTLSEHSILIVDSVPASGVVRLQVAEPGGGTFEKESVKGYAYHIIEKSPEHQGPYLFKVTNEGKGPVTMSVILGEDPYLSGKCNPSNQYSCYAIPAAIGIVIVGMLSLIVGSAIAINDFRKGRKRMPDSK